MDRRIIYPEELSSEQYDLLQDVDVSPTLRIVVREDNSSHTPWVTASLETLRWQFAGLSRWKPFSTYSLPAVALADFGDDALIEAMVQLMLERAIVSQDDSVAS